MTEPSESEVPVCVPREGVNDDVVQLLEWRFADGAPVRAGEGVVVLQTAKATFEVEARGDGFIHHRFQEGAEVPVGAVLAVISGRPLQKRKPIETPNSVRENGGQVITQKAQALMETHGLAADDFAGLAVVRAEDVEKALGKRTTQQPANRTFAGQELSPEDDWDRILKSGLYGEIREVLTGLRRRMKAKYNRHVPVGDHLYDRWELARDYGFGEGTSVYDECLILGDVKVGRACWIGPYTVLDGSHARLEVGDFVDIGAGTHLYTHNSIERALTGHRAPLFRSPTRIGNCCFLAPQVVIAPGTVLGDHCFVAAGSYVEGVFPPMSWLAGNPARRVGSVDIRGDRARLRPLAAEQP
jgi:acetyltransferase-like isoleucine patch superfamily enzyme